MAYLPSANAERVGIIASLNSYKEEGVDFNAATPVYLTYAGFVYRNNGVWHLINANASRFEECYFWDDTTREDVQLIVFDEQQLSSIAYSDAFASARLATYTESIEGFGYDSTLRRALRIVYGEKFVNNYDYVGVETGNGVAYMLGVATKNGIELVLGENRMGDRDYYYRVIAEVDLNNLEALFTDSFEKLDQGFSDIYITTDGGWWSSGSTFVLKTSMKIACKGVTYSFQGFTQAAKFIDAVKESCGA